MLQKMHVQCFANVLTPDECRNMRDRAEALGFKQPQEGNFFGGARERVTLTDTEIAQKVWSRIGPCISPWYHWWWNDCTVVADGKVVSVPWGKYVPCGINPCLRISKYNPGGCFKYHYDENYYGGPDVGFHTILIYLNNTFEGGATCFSDELGRINPQEGMAVVFYHRTLHCGNKVESGTKYVIRTEVMFKPRPWRFF